jgi:hypothetical protein
LRVLTATSRLPPSAKATESTLENRSPYVAIHVLLIDGIPSSGEGGWHYGKPLYQLERLRYWPWYVCPRTGLLRRVNEPRRKYQPPKRKKAPKYIRVTRTLHCRFFDNAWHLVTLQPLTSSLRQARPAVDILLNRAVKGIAPADARRYYGAEVYAVAKRRLARRELRHYPIPMQWWETGP